MSSLRKRRRSRTTGGVGPRGADTGDPEPPRPVGRPSNTEQRREEIIDALLSVMSRKGYEQASIALIARQAGLTAGLLHYHFETKQEILIALLERLVARRDQRLAARLSFAGDDPRAKLAAFIDAHVALGDDADPRAVAAWVVVGAEAVRERPVRTLYTAAIAAALARAREFVIACLEQEQRTTRNADRIAAAIVSAIEGAFLVHASAPGTLAEGYAAPTLRRMVDGLIDGEARRLIDTLRAAAPDGLDLPSPLLEELCRAWETPGRNYHSLTHLEDVVRLFRDVEAASEWRAPREAFLGLLFHDAVYVPGAGDNEARSAELARAAVARFLPGVQIDVDHVTRLILLTADHGNLAPEDVDHDAALALDCDMAILGAAPADFDAYHAGIAAEYAGMPRDVYEGGRRAFLSKLLDKERIFLSDFFHRTLDAPARSNLRRALAHDMR